MSDIAGTAGTDARTRIIDALMALLAEKKFERISLGDVAHRADVGLADLRAEFSSLAAILAAHMKRIDHQVLAADLSDMTEERPREKLFDLLMRRLDLLAPYKAAIRSLLYSALRDPPLALLLNGLAVRSLQFMLSAADIRVAGAKGVLRAQGLALLYGRVLQVWAHDDDPGLARTMAALDRELIRGARWSGYLDDLCCVPEIFCRSRRWRARRHRERSGEEGAAA